MYAVTESWVYCFGLSLAGMGNESLSWFEMVCVVKFADFLSFSSFSVGHFG